MEASTLTFLVNQALDYLSYGKIRNKSYWLYSEKVFKATEPQKTCLVK